MRIVVTGSLAYDYIMNFPGDFKEHILEEKVHALTVSFLVDSMHKMRGGVAGNVAYSLALLGERPLVVGSVGQDFGEYREWMEGAGVDVSGIDTVEGEFTASCFINTDSANNQIVTFYAGAMAHSREVSLEGLGLGPEDMALISPTDPEAMIRHADECRRFGVPFLFDPGKQTPRLTGEQILAGLEGAAVLISNEYELGMMAQKTGRTEEELISSAPLAIITRGAEGATIYQDGERSADVPVAPISGVVDPTGAGDAFLAGLVFGISRGFPLPIAGRVAALAGAYAVEQGGPQEHRYTMEEFARRYADAFGPSPEVEALAGTAVR